MGCSELIEAFLAANQYTFASHTLRAYRYDLTTFARLRPDILIHDITESHLHIYLDATDDLTSNTMARRKATLHACFGWAFRQGLLPADPTEKLKTIRIDVRVPQVHLDNQDGGYLQIVDKVTKERVIPLIDASRSVALLRNVLQTLDEGDPLFPGDVSKGGRHRKAINYTTIRKHFERYVDQARSTYSELFDDEKEPITIHRLRHTFATLKLRDGISLASVSMLLGHSSTQTTQYYTRFDLETTKRELINLETAKRELEEARQRKRHWEKRP